MMAKRIEQPPPPPRNATAPRRPVERVLPAMLIEQLRIEVRSAGEASARLARKLDKHLHIERDYGITRRRLHNFLAKLADGRERVAKSSDTPKTTDTANARTSCKNVTPAPKNRAGNDAKSDDASDSFTHRLRNHRVRQASVASILDKTFGKLAECAPDLWGHRAYLMLVGVVYERLAINEEDVSTEELVSLAKVIAENRRLEVRLHELSKPEQDNGQAKPNGPLPDHFGDIVRRVYGTNFAETAQAEPTHRVVPARRDFQPVKTCLAPASSRCEHGPHPLASLHQRTV